MTSWLMSRPGVSLVRDKTENATKAVHSSSHTVLRVALSVLFLWFGMLKIIGHSPVAGLLEATFPWANHTALMVGLGSVEVVLGIALLVRRLALVALVAAMAHLSGTFITFILVPEMMFQHGDLLLLTADGEFVAKNVVLIVSAMLLATSMLHQPEQRRQVRA